MCMRLCTSHVVWACLSLLFVSCVLLLVVFSCCLFVSCPSFRIVWLITFSPFWLRHLSSSQSFQFPFILLPTSLVSCVLLDLLYRIAAKFQLSPEPAYRSHGGRVVQIVLPSKFDKGSSPQGILPTELQTESAQLFHYFCRFQKTSLRLEQTCSSASARL